MEQDNNEILYIKKAIQSLDAENCTLIACWLVEYMKIIEIDQALYHTSIQQLNLSPRTKNVLKYNNINTIGSLIQLASNWDNVRVLRGAGKKVLHELDQKIKEIQKEI